MLVSGPTTTVASGVYDNANSAVQTSTAIGTLTATGLTESCHSATYV